MKMDQEQFETLLQRLQPETRLYVLINALDMDMEVPGEMIEQTMQALEREDKHSTAALFAERLGQTTKAMRIYIRGEFFELADRLAEAHNCVDTLIRLYCDEGHLLYAIQVAERTGDWEKASRLKDFARRAAQQ